jgi:uncharacterized cupredoxin-like copper-binding protein
MLTTRRHITEGAHPMRGRSILLSFLPLLVAAACTSTSADAEVAVSLHEDAVTLAPTEVGAGAVTFAATNEGTNTHEIEVFRGDVDPATLPVEDNVAVTDGLDLVDEIEDITPGSTANLTVELEPGTYVVMCNLPGHFEKGMHAVVTVA